MQGNFLWVGKEVSWRQMSVKSFRDGSQWPAIYNSTIEEEEERLLQEAQLSLRKTEHTVCV